MNERKCLLAAGNLLQAHVWKGLLQTAGIQVELRGEALHGGVDELPAELQNVQLWVKESLLMQALAQLDSIACDRPMWLCLNCHELNEAHVELCWNCSSERSKTYQ